MLRMVPTATLLAPSLTCFLSPTFQGTRGIWPVMVTSISTNCILDRSIEFFCQEDVTDFMGG